VARGKHHPPHEVFPHPAPAPPPPPSPPQRLLVRTAYVCITCIIAIVLPFFGAIVGLVSSGG
jgi:hypothetical protein